MLRQIECIITGRVQGVLYRHFAMRRARSFGLFGLVDNPPDGTVHIIAQGDQSELDKYIEELKKGSIFSKVESVDVKWSNSDKVFPDFSIRHHNSSDNSGTPVS